MKSCLSALGGRFVLPITDTGSVFRLSSASAFSFSRAGASDLSPAQILWRVDSIKAGSRRNTRGGEALIDKTGNEKIIQKIGARLAQPQHARSPLTIESIRSVVGKSL